MNKITIKVNVGENDLLSNNIAHNKKHLIQELYVYGHYCAENNDKFIKSMCNTIDDSGIRTGGQLELLDLSNAKIRDGRNYNSYHLRYNSFSDCITLKTIILSELHGISPSIFNGCISLTAIEYSGLRTFTSINGILYQKGCLKSLDQYIDFKYGEWKLVKFPAAKDNVKDIKFNNINQIGDYAFADFKGSDLYLSVIPPSCSEYAFLNVDTSKVTIHVPKESYDSYWSHPIWGNFHIVGDNVV